MTRTMRAALPVWWAWLLVAAISGCSAKPESNPGGGGPSCGTTPCDQYACAFCNLLSSCAPSLVADDLGDVGTCTTRVAAYCEVALAAPGTGSSPDSTTRCAKSLPMATCSQLMARCRSFGSGCIDFFPAAVPGCEPTPGELADGASCTFDAQCAGAACQSSGGCGKCAPIAKRGESCDGLRCDVGDVCAGVCVAPPAVGDPCSGPLSAGTLVCEGGVYVEPGAPGAACKIACDEPHFVYCNQALGVCQAANVVQPGDPGPVVPVNDPRSPPTFCAGDWGVDGACHSRAAEGEACDEEAENPTNCFAPASCTGGRCVFPVACGP